MEIDLTKNVSALLGGNGAPKSAWIEARFSQPSQEDIGPGRIFNEKLPSTDMESFSNRE